jgi:hypothetical protein
MAMDFRRVRAWDRLSALAGLILFVDLFVPWYGAGGQTANAWESFAYVDLILALAALMAIALALVSALARVAAVPKLVATWTSWVALVAAILAVIRLIKVPGGVDVLLTGGGADITREWGVFVGAVVAVVLAVGAWRARQDSSFPGPLRAHAGSERAGRS